MSRSTVWCIAAVNEFLSWKGLLLWWRRGWCWPRWDAVQWEGSRHPTTLPPAFISLPQILPLIRTCYRTDQEMQRIHDLKEIISNCPNPYKSRYVAASPACVSRTIRFSHELSWAFAIGDILWIKIIMMHRATLPIIITPILDQAWVPGISEPALLHLLHSATRLPGLNLR